MENGIANVANALHGDGFEIHVCCMRIRGRFAERMPDPELVRSLEKAPGFSLRWARALRRHINKVRPEIIHSHNLGALIYTGLATVLKRGAPIVHGEHAELNADEQVTRRLAVRRLLYRRCHAVHTVSDSLTSHLEAIGMPTQRLQTIRNGVDTKRFTPEGKTANLPFAKTDQVIGMVGRFGEFKGHQQLIEAFELICDEHDDLRLLLLGDGGPRKQAVLDQITNSRAGKHIHWAGLQDDPAAFYRAMNLLVVPSTNEGLSNAILEAMACGTPVLASDSCGSGEAITGCPAGTVADMSSAESIASAVRESLQDAGELRAAARQHALNHFSFDQMVDCYRQLYTSSRM